MNCSYCYKDLMMLIEGSNADGAGDDGSAPNNDTTFVVCQNCKTRRYCSAECQHKDETSHAFYCGISGQEGVDFCIRETSSSSSHVAGFGVFALRDFSKDEIIMVERPIVFGKLSELERYDMNEKHHNDNDDLIPTSARHLYDSLLPHEGSLTAKIRRNAFSCSPDEGGLFLLLSRVNHDCIGNSDHLYLAHRGVKILVATTSIPKGHEITYSYTGHGTLTSQARREHLEQQYHFDCKCQSVCSSPNRTTIESDLDQLVQFQFAIGRLARDLQKIPEALAVGKHVLALKRRYHCGSWSECCTWNDLFQVAVTQRATLPHAKKCAQQAYRAVVRFTHNDAASEPVRQMKELVTKPLEEHDNYLAFD